MYFFGVSEFIDNGCRDEMSPVIPKLKVLVIKMGPTEGLGW
jgi:hypothetical protein